MNAPVNTSVLNSAAPLMSSLEIAAVTDKLHKNVLRDIKVSLIEMYGVEHLATIAIDKSCRAKYLREHCDELLESVFGDGYIWSHLLDTAFSLTRDARGYICEIHLDREHALTIVSGYNIVLRKRVVDRLSFLEKQTAEPKNSQLPDFTDPVAIARAWADEREGRQVAEVKAVRMESLVDELRPKSDAIDAISAAPGSRSISDTAKELKVPIDWLFRWLESMCWAFKRPLATRWVYGDAAWKSGWMDNHTSTIDINPLTNQGRSIKKVSNIHVTSVGFAKLAERLAVLTAAGPLPTFAEFRRERAKRLKKVTA